MKQCFSSYFYFQYRMPNFDVLVDRLKTASKYNDDNFTWGDLCKIDRESLVIDDWCDLLSQPMQLLSQDLGLTITARLSHPWVNLYDRGGFQEIHYHDDCDIAAVICLNDGPDFSKFYFWDGHHTDYSHAWIKMMPKLGWSNIYYPDIKAGDIIFFPSHMFHGVTPHNSDTIRKTMSFNIYINNVE